MINRTIRHVLMVAAASVLGAANAHADAAAGRKLAGGMCQTCHGIDGLAKIPVAPNLAGESDIYLRAQLEAFRSGKRENEMMSVVAKGLSDEQIADVAAWYASIKLTVTVPE